MTTPEQPLLEFATAEAARCELVRIGEAVNVWPLGGEALSAFGFRVQLAITEEILAREELLNRALSLSKAATQDQP